MNTAQKPPRSLKNTKGISPVISTIIISATLLIILVIASFISTNILELQVANTEFEQAKTNMLLLDEVIQDVALRPGAGGYVQFNQRSGGINIIQTSETLTILGPSSITEINANPSANSGSWTNPDNAYSSDDQYATATNENWEHQFKNYNLNIPEGSIITKVEVGYEAKATKGAIRITCSWNNGESWAPEKERTLSETDTDTTSWLDFTDVTNWTPEKLQNSKFLVRVKSVKYKGGVDIGLDWIPVRVTYTPPLSSIGEIQNLVMLVYRGGSKVSGADTRLKGYAVPFIPFILSETESQRSVTDSLSYVRVETGSGVQIKLDYNRARVTEAGTLRVGDAVCNFIEITIIRLVKGDTSGSDTVTVKAQNIGIHTTTTTYPSGNVPLSFRLGGSITQPVLFTSEYAEKTVVSITVIDVKISIS